MNSTSRNLVVGALAAVSLASSASAAVSVELIAGWNFGQFISSGVPSTDGTTGDAIGSIPSNYAGSTRPLDSDSGPSHILSGNSTTFSAGSGVLNFSAWDFANGVDVSVVELGGVSAINATAVDGLQMYPGDTSNAHLRFAVGSVSDFTISLDTSSFADFDPLDFSQTNDFNLTLAAYKGSGTVASIEWFLNGSSVGTTSTNSGNFAAFSVDLPADFYGQSNAVLTGRVTGDIVIDNVQINGVTAVPEPASYAVIAAVAGLGLAVARRRRA